MAALSHAIALRDPGLAFAVDHEMAADSPAFLDSMEGSTGVPLLRRQRASTLLNNGDEFYPSMLEAIRGAQRSITIEAYIYWRGEIGLEFAQAIAERAQAGVVGEAPARHGRLGDHRPGDPRTSSRAAAVSWRGSTRSAGTRSTASTTAPTASR